MIFSSWNCNKAQVIFNENHFVVCLKGNDGMIFSIFYMLEISKFDCPTLNKHKLYKLIPCRRNLMKFSEKSHNLSFYIDLWNVIKFIEEFTDLLPKQKGISSFGTQCMF